MSNHHHNNPVFESIANVLSGIASTTEVLAAITASNPSPKGAGPAQGIPPLVQLTKQLVQLKIQLYSYGDTDDSVQAALDALKIEYEKIGIEWFVTYFQVAAFSALTPLRRFAIATWLVEMAKVNAIPAPSFWLQIINSQGLLDHE